MNALEQALTFRGNSRASKDSESKHTVLIENTANDFGGCIFASDPTGNKRRVQIPLSGFSEDIVKKLRERWKISSNASVIQIALAFLCELVALQKAAGDLVLEGPAGTRSVPNVMLLGYLNHLNEKQEDKASKYQIMLTDSQIEIMKDLIIVFDASSLAELIRLAIRTMRGISDEMQNNEILLARYDKYDREIMFS